MDIITNNIKRPQALILQMIIGQLACIILNKFYLIRRSDPKSDVGWNPEPIPNSE